MPGSALPLTQPRAGERPLPHRPFPSTTLTPTHPPEAEEKPFPLVSAGDMPTCSARCARTGGSEAGGRVPEMGSPALAPCLGASDSEGEHGRDNLMGNGR